MFLIISLYKITIYYFHFSMLILTLKILNTIVSITTQSSSAEFFIFIIMHWYMSLNASSMSESIETSLALQWTILDLFLFLYSKTNFVSTLNLFSSLNNSFNFFYHAFSDQLQFWKKKFKISILLQCTQLSEWSQNFFPLDQIL